MKNTIEKQGLIIAIIGSSVFGILGIVFAIITTSQAVLLDGAFNLVAAIMAIIGLKIATSLSTPESEHYPIGFFALESLFVLGKGLILLMLTGYVIVNNIIILVNGGSNLNLGFILIYLTIALSGNIIVFLLIRKKNAQTKSPILEIEKENWKVNTLITAGIALAILVSMLLKDSFIKEYVQYIDQVIVIIVAVVSLPVPISAIREGIRDLLLFAPPEHLKAEIQNIINREKNHYTGVDINKSVVLKTGRKLWVTLFVYSSNKMLPTDLSDQIRNRVSSLLSNSIKEHNVDVIITNQ